MQSTDTPPVLAAVFDAFGTTVRIERKRHPFRQLLRIGAAQGRRPSADDLHTLMTSSLSLEAAAQRFGIRLSAQQLQLLQGDLEDELDSIALYPDTLEAFNLLKASGVAVGICSNLAQPYGPVVRGLLNSVDAFALSYEVGVMKPHPGIYRQICSQLGVAPAQDFTLSQGRVVMIGDSVSCDQDGPRSIGIFGYHLDRQGQGRITSLRQFAELLAGRQGCQ